MLKNSVSTFKVCIITLRTQKSKLKTAIVIPYEKKCEEVRIIKFIRRILFVSIQFYCIDNNKGKNRRRMH